MASGKKGDKKNDKGSKGGVSGKKTRPKKQRAEVSPEISLGAMVVAATVGDVHAAHPVSLDERRSMIAEAAYYIAEQRGFATGDAMADWLAAEAMVDHTIAENRA